MDLGSEVDLSNGSIAPLWKKRTNGHTKPRPLSYQIDGIIMTDFPSDKSTEQLSTPVGGSAVLKHVLNKPVPRKTRVVRSISIGRLTDGRFSLARFTSEDSKGSVEMRSPKQTPSSPKVGNGFSIRDPLRRLSGQVTLTTQRDQIVFRDSPGGPQEPCSLSRNVSRRDCPTTLPREIHGSPMTLRTPSAHSSTSSIPSLSSPSSSSPSTPSEPATPRTPSPSETESVVLLRQSSGSSQGSQGKPSTPTVVLSTHSPAAQKIGTQQLIPRSLVSETRPSKSGSDRQGLSGLLDPSKRTLRARSMVEGGPYFSTSREDEEEAEEGPGLQRRGLRSTSYRRAVVSGVDLDSPLADIKNYTLSHPVFKGVADVKEGPGSPRSAKSQSAKKKKGLQSQRTFDSEEDEVLYQNYQEKALHNDSDEDAESREAKPDENIVVQNRLIRISWSQLSVVKKSGVAEKLSQEERKRQETIFEVISSEHSYLHSLMILIRLFKNSPELSETMTKTDHHHLFSNIVDVCETSTKFFKELEDRHQQNIVIDDISDIVVRHAQANFEPYVTYCSNEVYQQRTLQRLLSKSPSFKEVLSRIEAHPDCRNLPMCSFLILPMQRVTRLPLLIDTICQKTPKDSPLYEECTKALHCVSKLVRKCNEGARKMERTEMMYTINSQLEFKIKLGHDDPSFQGFLLVYNGLPACVGNSAVVCCVRQRCYPLYYKNHCLTVVI
ncbi:rho guanine nucleotide exchange factor 26-like isoform X2 [Hoplias malabaricus]|uniref:rho guanine nucleotide exchange factor 26-like isoform X2 n=1 Tax=Hoplias malabaricus TaxID=27720 RepID=UPI003461D465